VSDSILIVDDERGIRGTLRAVLEDEGFETEAVASGEECLKAVERRAFGCVLLDVWLPGIDGLETLSLMREKGADSSVVMISGHGNIETAVRSTKLGAFDFIEKPLSIEKTVLTVRNALRQRELERVNAALAAELSDEWAMVGESVAMRALRKQIEMVDGATLFLDEVGDMSARMQAKVLRVLEEQRFEPVGSTTPMRVDVRVIAATNKRLEVEIEKGNFRTDLLFRLNVIPFEVPPLRERTQVIPHRVEHYNHKYTVSYKKSPKRYDADAVEALRSYSWPGNVRELRNTVERVVIMHTGPKVTAADLPALGGEEPAPTPARFSSFRDASEAHQRDFIRAKLAAAEGNVSR